MAAITLLTPAQLAEREQKPKGPGRSGRRRSEERTRRIEGYKAALQGVAPGYGADVLLADDEHKKHVRNDLHIAADELNLALVFRPVKDPSRLHVRFITHEEQAALPKRRGRPRNSALAEATAGDGAGEHAQTPEPMLLPTPHEQSTEAPKKPEPPKKRTRRPSGSTT